MQRVLELGVVEIGLETECESRLRWAELFLQEQALQAPPLGTALLTDGQISSESDIIRRGTLHP